MGIKKKVFNRFGERIDRHLAIFASATYVILTGLAIGSVLYQQATLKRDKAIELSHYVASIDSLPGFSSRDLGDFAHRSGLDSAVVINDTSRDFRHYFDQSNEYTLSAGDRALNSYRNEPVDSTN